ncbi:hypothetical protein KPSA1_07596 [Pseudomonas syringae pv. actinidiae]|uniref:Uncharacterized protein n=1 Tax=Pseudomonas syringae pv. actinidiae TaxID=103796 RepID=A0A2V0QMQ1_PSESF|nr:hypothetical protein KPSA1_07596 [Pseudomonas syringae pv. actinidiae]
MRVPGGPYNTENPHEGKPCHMLNISCCATLKLWTYGVCVAACNRNGADLQSSRFSTRIDCVYPSQQTGIICE